MADNITILVEDINPAIGQTVELCDETQSADRFARTICEQAH
jgi:hypothetical protein